MERITTAEFIRRAVILHGDKYDYSRVVYNNCRSLVCVGCKKHGWFQQKAELHLRGSGCPDCGGTKRLTTDVFVKRAKQKHGDEYDYHLAEYKSDTHKVKIVCPVHGEFLQRPADHLNGRGCPKCGGTAKSTTEEFVEKARRVHGERYDYSSTIYVSDATKLWITCSIHGDFLQTPNDHLQAVGCPKCGGTARLTTEEFVGKATKVHGLKYDYSRVEYATSHKKVKIVCPIHGSFRQKPNAHLNGVGCAKCSESKGEKAVRQFLDANGIVYKYQHCFPTCRRKRRLPFDFVIETDSGMIAIEFQGEQHYRPVSFGGDAKKNFRNIRRTDEIKRVWCKENDVRLIEIRYDAINKIPVLLNELHFILRLHE